MSGKNKLDTVKITDRERFDAAKEFAGKSDIQVLEQIRRGVRLGKSNGSQKVLDMWQFGIREANRRRIPDDEVKQAIKEGGKSEINREEGGEKKV